MPDGKGMTPQLIAHLSASAVRAAGGNESVAAHAAGVAAAHAAPQTGAADEDALQASADAAKATGGRKLELREA